MASLLVDDKAKACVDACAECVQTCEACAYQCCIPSGQTEMSGCAQRCLDCAAICALCVTLLARGSALAERVCQLCSATRVSIWDPARAAPTRRKRPPW